jgi:hypothetical protein
MLCEESGIAEEIITARGYFTATTKVQLKELGFADTQRRVPALVVPVYNVDGALATYQARPDQARVKKGKSIKYETPSGTRMVLDISPSSRHYLDNPKRPLWITEGVKKGDALATRGCCAIALLGVWSWRGTNAHGGKAALSDWEHIALNGRLTYIVFDSDVMTKPEVHQGLARLKAFLEQRGATVALVYLPAGKGGAKQGVDDYLVAGHTIDDLLALATPELRLPLEDQSPHLPYRATPHGLVWDKSTKDGIIPVPLTNFTATINADIVEDDGAEPRHIFDMEARRNGQTVHFQLAASHFPGMQWVVEYLGASALVYPGVTLKDQARAAIQLLSGEVPTRHVYKHTGWRQVDGQWLYLHAGGAIGEQGAVPDVAVTLDSALAHYRLIVPDSQDEARQAMQASLRLLDIAPDPLMVPVYSAIWRAGLGHVEHSLFLAGKTGAGKTAIAALALQHYGASMDAQRLPASWSSTGNALEGLTFLAKDALLVIDDFCPTGSPADVQRYHKEADRVLRAQGNTSGRQRMRPDGTLRAVKPPRGLLLATGEDVPHGQSLRARTFILEVPPETLQNNKVQFTACQSDAGTGLYTKALAGFCQWLAPRYAVVQASLDQELRQLRAHAISGAHLRTAESMAQLALGLRGLLAYALDVGAITDADHIALWHRGWTALTAAATAQPEQQDSEDPVHRFFTLLPAVLTAGHAHVVDAGTLDKPVDAERWGWRYRQSVTENARGQGTVTEWQPQGDQIGWLHGDRLYLEPEATYRVVTAFTESQRKPIALTQRMLWKRMQEQGFLAVEPSQKHKTVRREIGPSKQRKRVIDIANALLSPETGPSGPTGPHTDNAQKNNVPCQDFPDRFPPWYGQHRSGAQGQNGPEASSITSIEDRIDAGTNSWTSFPPLLDREMGSQALETQRAGPLGPLGPEIAPYTVPDTSPAVAPPPTIPPARPLQPSDSAPLTQD